MFDIKKCLLSKLVAGLCITFATGGQAADYPPSDIDYGQTGDFIVKRGVEFGRTADLTLVGPVLINFPEGPGSSRVGLPNNEFRFEDTAWDLSDLTNPTMIRSLTCENCFAAQPIAAHATVIRFTSEFGPLIHGGNSGEIAFDPSGATSNDQVVVHDDTTFEWKGTPLGYANMFSPYHIRAYWEYGFDPTGVYAIRDLDQPLPDGPITPWTVEGTELADIVGETETGVWLGELLTYWNHFELASVTGFTSWLGNLLIVSSDQQSTGMAIYEVDGFKDGIQPELISTFQPVLTEPNGHNVGLGGYWMEPYGANKMVWAARRRENLIPSRDYPAVFVVDFSNPRNPHLTCELYFDQDPNDPSDGDGSSDPMYVNFQDQYIFSDHFRIDLELCEAAYEDGNISSAEFDEIVFRFTDIPNGCDGSQYYRALGQVGVFGGYDFWVTPDVNEQGMCFFVAHDEPDTNPPFVSGHRPLQSRTHYPVDGLIHFHIPETLRTETVQNAVTLTNLTSGQQVEFWHQLSHTGTLAIWPKEDLADNSGYLVELEGIQDFAGNTMAPYSFCFSTGDASLIDRQECATQGVGPTPVPTPTPTATPVPTATPTPTATPEPTDAPTPTPTPTDSPNPTTPPNPTEPPEPTVTPEPTRTPVPTPTPVPSFDGVVYYPNKSSQIACQPEVENGNVWAVNPDNDSVAIIAQHYDSESMRVSPELLREIRMNYQGPSSVTKIREIFAVTYRDDDKVVFFNNAAHPLFAIDTGYGTQPISAVADGNDLLVALYGSGEIIKIDILTRAISSRLEVGPKPKAMALAANRLLVTRFISPRDHGVVYDVNTNGDMSLTGEIVINKVTVPDDIDHGSGVPNYLSSIVINQDNTRAYVTASKANTDRGMRPDNTINRQPLDSDNTVRPMIATINLTTSSDMNTNPSARSNTSDLDNGAEPTGIIFLADPSIRVHLLRGNNVAVANNLDLNTSTQYRVGSAPQDMCATLRTLYVKNFTGRSVSAVDVAGFMYNNSIAQRVQTISTVTNEVLSDQELRGLQEFYHSSQPEMGEEGYMSCASCHDGGGHDGRVWDITSMGEGLRNTLSLNGSSGTRFGNLHWSGNFDEVQDFEIQMEQLNEGEGLIPGRTFTTQSPLEHQSSGQSERLDALAAYITGLGKSTVKRSPYKTYTGELSEAAQRGLAVYQADNCGTCHAGPAYRDGQRHDVGTITTNSGQRLGGVLDAIRTPTLIELWDSYPYFHDGSAETLNEVFDRGDHARTFTGTQEADLIEYLLSIDREDYIDDDAQF